MAMFSLNEIETEENFNKLVEAVEYCIFNKDLMGLIALKNIVFSEYTQGRISADDFEYLIETIMKE